MHINRAITAIVLVLSMASVQAVTADPDGDIISRLPDVPDNICGASEQSITTWNDRLLALKYEVAELLDSEKNAEKEAMKRAVPREDIFSPANAERIQQLAEEIRQTEERANAILEQLASRYIERRAATEMKYDEQLETLRQRANNSAEEERAATMRRIGVINGERCKELAAIRSEYLKQYRSRLDEIVELGRKSNRLSDEFTSLGYSGYSFVTRYGFWLGFVSAFVDELLHVYDDIPATEKQHEDDR